jgi:hypothetical protein
LRKKSEYSKMVLKTARLKKKPSQFVTIHKKTKMFHHLLKSQITNQKRLITDKQIPIHLLKARRIIQKRKIKESPTKLARKTIKMKRIIESIPIPRKGNLNSSKLLLYNLFLLL